MQKCKTQFVVALLTCWQLGRILVSTILYYRAEPRKFSIITRWRCPGIPSEKQKKTQGDWIQHDNPRGYKCGNPTFYPKIKKHFWLDFSKSHLKAVLLRPYPNFGQKVRFSHLNPSRLMWLNLFKFKDLLPAWVTISGEWYPTVSRSFQSETFRVERVLGPKKCDHILKPIHFLGGGVKD